MSHLHLLLSYLPLSLSRPLAPLLPSLSCSPNLPRHWRDISPHAAVSSHRFRGRGTCARPRHCASGLTDKACGETAVGGLVDWGGVVGAAAGAQRWCIRSTSPRQGVSRGGGHAGRYWARLQWKGSMGITLRSPHHSPTAGRRALFCEL